MKKINGRVYPLWQQFLDRKKEWIGGRLVDIGTPFDREITGVDSAATDITDITLESNGEESAYFRVHGKDFNCGFDVRHGGIDGSPISDDGLQFCGYGGHTFRMYKPAKTRART